jgi:hypothetical protein
MYSDLFLIDTIEIKLSLGYVLLRSKRLINKIISYKNKISLFELVQHRFANNKVELLLNCGFQTTGPTSWTKCKLD